MPPSDPATVRLADCPVGAVVRYSHGDPFLVRPIDRNAPDDYHAVIIAPSLAALVARAEAGARLADDVEYAEKLLPLSSDSGVLRQALAAYRKATA